jgi:hypothetical protein
LSEQVLGDQVTTLAQAPQQSIPEAPASVRRRGRLSEKIRTIALGIGFPLLLIVCGTVPSP